MFDNGLGDRDSIPGRVIPKPQKWYLLPPSLTQHYKVQIKCMWNNPSKEVPLSSTHQRSGYKTHIYIYIER